jgi:hypothetical protein
VFKLWLFKSSIAVEAKFIMAVITSALNIRVYSTAHNYSDFQMLLAVCTLPAGAMYILIPCTPFKVSYFTQIHSRILVAKQAGFLNAGTYDIVALS